MKKLIPGILLALGLLLITPDHAGGQDPLAPEALLKLESVSAIQISPDGKEVIYTVLSPRGPNDNPGPSNRTYFRISLTDRIPKPIFEDLPGAASPALSPDGLHIGFLYAAGDQPRQVWMMAASGGEVKQLTHSPSGVSQFKWQPGKRGIAYISGELTSQREKELDKRGYGFIFYEENLKNDHLYLAQYDEDWSQKSLWQLTREGQTWDFEFDPGGARIAASVSPRNLIDHRYMFRKIYLIDLSSGAMRQVSQNEGKLGNYAFSPDGSHLGYAAALNINDSQVSQAFVVNLASGSVSNLTPRDFKGHVNWVSWKDDSHLLCLSDEGVYPTLSELPLKGGKRKVILNAADQGIIFGAPLFSSDFEHFVFSGSTPSDMSNLYHWDGKGELEKLTRLNPGLEETLLGKQEVIGYSARDGQEIEGILIYPLAYERGRSYPLIVYVHGGPESHETNGWKSRYSTPGQVMAGKGYLVLYLNYRASTGYGVDFAMEGFMDPAGKEFDDIADAIEWAVSEKGADPERVGLAGGSYGGYASAWFATYYTRYVKAVCMFVGISNSISKRGTTDIPYEELHVHSGKKLEEQWQLDLERSPVYWAHQSKTATLIYGGAADTRVHPSQSFELYRRMKMNDHPAVRLVQYPGEGHGNRNQVGQIDVLYRQMEWLDWYVRDKQPLDGPMPRLDISDRYGLDWNY